MWSSTRLLSHLGCLVIVPCSDHEKIRDAPCSITVCHGIPSLSLKHAPCHLSSTPLYIHCSFHGLTPSLIPWKTSYRTVLACSSLRHGDSSGSAAPSQRLGRVEKRTAFIRCSHLQSTPGSPRSVETRACDTHLTHQVSDIDCGASGIASDLNGSIVGNHLGKDVKDGL
jgi:hypothetical protein